MLMAAVGVTLESLFCPPIAIKGLKVLDKALFTKRVTVPAIILPAKKTALFLRHLKDVVLHVTGIRKFAFRANESERVREKEREIRITLTVSCFNIVAPSVTN